MATDQAMSDRPSWKCEVCELPIAGDDGVLFMEYGDLRRRDDALDAWRQAHPGPAYSGEDHATYPERVHWHVRHHACGGEGEAVAVYVIESGRIDTWRKVAGWTAHLMEKRWLGDTDWAARLYSAGVGAI